ncbi:ribonuclease H-like domain-containing protein, partial [Tanacetum coccineum]
MLAKSSAEAEYRAKNTVTCEVIWIHKILTELNVQISLSVPIHCDNSFAIHIAANPVFHEKTKHFEIKLITISFVISWGYMTCTRASLWGNVKMNKQALVSDIFSYEAYAITGAEKYQRTKYTEIDIHFVRDLVATSQVRVLHVSSRYQFAD